MTDIEIFKGNDKQWLATAKNSAGVAQDITGAAITFSVKKTLDSNKVLFTRKNTAAGGSSAEIDDTDLANGQFTVIFVPANTQNLEPGEYEYDVNIVVSGKEYTGAQDQLEIKDTVTV